MLLWRVCISCLSTCSRNQSRGCRSHGLVASAGISNEPFPHVTHPFVGCCLSCRLAGGGIACRARSLLAPRHVKGTQPRAPAGAALLARAANLGKKSCFRRGMRAPRAHQLKPSRAFAPRTMQTTPRQYRGWFSEKFGISSYLSV